MQKEWDYIMLHHYYIAPYFSLREQTTSTSASLI
jgi:hypothetical protein